MRPIRFSCRKIISLRPSEIMAQISDTERWKEFTGYGILPGIAEAYYIHKTGDMKGSRIQVKNTDASSHVEEILLWQEGQRIEMKMYEFSPPLKYIASHFLETWAFDKGEDEKTTLILRSFELYPKFWLTCPILWLISLVFRKAITHNLDDMATLGK